MSNNLDRVRSELESLGRQTKSFVSPIGEVIFFPYEVELRSHEKKEVKVGISMQGDEQYPEYPPHWIHVSPPINDGRGGPIHEYVDAEGNSWIALSRPPKDFWDQLPTKHMSVYLEHHIRRFWKDI